MLGKPVGPCLLLSQHTTWQGERGPSSAVAMNRHFRRLDGTIPVAALLYEDEELVASQDGVGLYDGKRCPSTRTGRCILLPIASSTSMLPSLANTRQLVILIVMLSAYDDPGNPSTPDDASEQIEASADVSPVDEIPSREGWVCPICSYNNPASASESAPACVLCGVPKNDNIPMPQQFKSMRESRVSSRPALSIPTHATSSSLPSVSSVPNAPSPVAPNGEIACPACTFFNHPSMTHCEICSTPLGDVRLPAIRSPKPSRISSVSSPTTPARTPDPNARDMIKFSFRKGGDKVWYAALKRTLLAKAWARAPTSKAALPSTHARGIHGILQSVEINAQTTHDDMEDALKDLEALMSKAREMASLSYARIQEEEKRQRLEMGVSTSDANAHAPSESETTFIRSSLARLGLPTDAVTQDMVADEQVYHTELAKELSGLLLGGGVKGKSKTSEQRGIMADLRGIVGLDEVWGAWNRARGVALLPPSTLLKVVPLLPRYTSPPIHMRTLRSGLRVLHTPEYTREEFARRIDQALKACFPQGRTAFQIAADEGASVSLAMVQEMVECAEEDGVIARDEVGGSGEVRWLPNLFIGYVWDGD
ncbi:vacuolar protein-sorting-associated protein 36 [Ceratobasidium sp. AG-Ba]|nr:vacuolar protein-sorting-associated protein 36 [Ceratobasidium sp. AG-Ba]QRV99449.1 vacuolar protein-sorting-associated protein 36 [Ceratobasidium sp. AG-Ba]